MSTHRGTLASARALCELSSQLCARARIADKASRRALARSAPLWEQLEKQRAELDELGSRIARIASVAELVCPPRTPR